MRHCRKKADALSRNSGTKSQSESCKTQQSELNKNGEFPSGKGKYVLAEKAFRHKLENKEQIPSKLEVRGKLKLPPAKDKKWVDIDEDLSKLLSQCKRTEDPCKDLVKAETIIFQYLEDSFGVFQQRNNMKQGGSDKSSQQRQLRRKKNALKSELRSAIRQGKDESEISMIKKTFWQVMRLHNKVRKLELSNRKRKSCKLANRRFRKNPFAYSRQLLSDKKSRVQPQFGKEKAEIYFKETYSDKKRNRSHVPMSEMKRPQKPEKHFALKAPSRAEFRGVLRRMRNKSSPGPNGISYLVYKQCRRVFNCISNILTRIWKDQVIPLEWRVGISILIPKSNDLSDPSLFRNITMTNVSGKILLKVLANRLVKYMMQNNYFDIRVQKGFLPGVSGCVEHTQALMEMLVDAKVNKQDVVVLWCDLANAYGSVNHNLVQFALEWYHIPEPIRKIIFAYYDQLFVMVKTEKWTTDLLRFEKGLFQGCPLSVVLFLLVFNLLLDLISQHQHLGYSFSGKGDTKLSVVQKAYADDLTLISGSVGGMKTLAHLMSRFLEWTGSMQAKPVKCRTLGLMRKKQGKRFCSEPFDPEISINGEYVQFIHQETFKFLGQEIAVDLTDKQVRESLFQKVNGLLETIDRDPVDGMGKLWLYQHSLLPKIAWEFTIYNFPLSFAQELERVATKHLKKWAGLSHGANISILYRRRSIVGGLNLTPISMHLKKMQVIKYHQLKYSVDEDIQFVYGHMENRLGTNKRWNGVRELIERERQQVINELCRGQVSRAGLGMNPQLRYEDMSPDQQRRQLGELIREITENDLLLRLYNLEVQGRPMTWEAVMSLDVTWNKLLYSWSPKLLSFCLNSIQDTLPTPSNLEKWKKVTLGKCFLCPNTKCTLMHILNNCPSALRQGRYNWRHDMVLRAIVSAIIPAVENQRRVSKPGNFITASGKGYAGRVPQLEENKLIPITGDWKVIWDEEYDQAVFPPQICSTSSRPDIVIFSEQLKVCVIVELTIPAEENMTDAHDRKNIKYQSLVSECERQSWKVKYFPVEVGSRGFPGTSLRHCLKYFRLSNKQIKVVSDEVSNIALKASYTIWLARGNEHFGRWELKERPQTREPQITSNGPNKLVHKNSVKPAKSTKKDKPRKVRVSPDNSAMKVVKFTGEPSTLYNVGNSCYYNALLQCLYHAGLLPTISDGRESKVTTALASLKVKLDQKTVGVHSPQPVKAAVGSIVPRFSTNSQEDAAELLMSITDILENELGSHSPLGKQVQGFIDTETNCQVCLERRILEREPFTQLQLSIPEEVDECTLKECWDLNFGDTLLTDAACTFCGKVGSRIRHHTVILSEYLIITLKRFESDEHGIHKNNAYVQVPFVNWTPMGGSPTYKLIATVDHRGVSPTSGHYVANCLRDTWYLLDDSRAQPKLPAFVTCRDNYILFYHTS